LRNPPDSFPSVGKRAAIRVEKQIISYGIALAHFEKATGVGKEPFRKMGKSKKQTEAKLKGRRMALWLAGLVTSGLLVWGWMSTGDSSREPNSGVAARSGYARRETRTPLSPALFVGQTARAYQVAWEIPEILDQLYCYCGCDKHLDHVSLLSCFTDDHGAT
jgi:hypothetical protein